MISVQCSLQVSGASLKQVEKFKCIVVVFMSDGRQDGELDTQMGKTGAVIRALQYFAVMKHELLKKAKLLVFKTVFILILTYGHESWVMPKEYDHKCKCLK